MRYIAFLLLATAVTAAPPGVKLPRDPMEIKRSMLAQMPSPTPKPPEVNGMIEERAPSSPSAPPIPSVPDFLPVPQMLKAMGIPVKGDVNRRMPSGSGLPLMPALIPVRDGLDVKLGPVEVKVDESSAPAYSGSAAAHSASARPAF